MNTRKARRAVARESFFYSGKLNRTSGASEWNNQINFYVPPKAHQKRAGVADNLWSTDIEPAFLIKLKLNSSKKRPIQSLSVVPNLKLKKCTRISYVGD
jgi:hypothetical protein